MNETHKHPSLRDKILDTALKLFVEKGIRAVKMDDIANSISISKRTLYETFDNKEELLIECVKRAAEIRKKELDDYSKTGASVMDVILHAFSIKLKEMGLVNPLFYAELERYPKLLEHFDCHHSEHQRLFVDFLMRGVNEGFFRPDLNYDFVAQLVDANNRYVMQNKLYMKYSMHTVILNGASVMLRGICTRKGMEELDHFLATHVDG